MATKWVLDGPGGKWSIWDHGDELCVLEGDTILGRLVARVRPEICRKIDGPHKRHCMERAASAIHTAKLLGSDSPTLTGLWSAK